MNDLANRLFDSTLKACEGNPWNFESQTHLQTALVG
jgi:hypothetical protein